MKRFGLLLIASLFLCTVFLAYGHADEAAVTGCTWQDKNGDGIFEGEKGMGGVSVSLEKKLENGSTKSINNFITGNDGVFLFDGLEPGEYRLSFRVPEGYHFSFHGIDSVALPSGSETSITPFFTLKAGDRLQLNAGVSKFSTYITLVSFYDNNANGGRMSSEEPVHGIGLTLLYEYGGKTYEVASGSTNMKGESVIRNITPGTYTLRAELPDNMTAGPMGQKLNTFNNCFLPGDGNTAYSVPFTLPYKGNIGLAIGIVRTGSLKGSLRYDADSNGVWDAGEAAVPGAQVILQSDNLQSPLSAVLNEQGDFLFTCLQPGSFDLIYRLPDGYLFSDSEASLLHGTDSEGALKVSVQEGNTTSVDAVMYNRGASVSMKITEDENADGIADAEEPPIPGITVELSQNGSIVGTEATDAEGTSYFPAARHGEAVFRVTLPDGYVFTDSGEKERTKNVHISDEEIDFVLCAVRTSSVTGILFDDPTNTGIYGDKSAPLAGFSVIAINNDGEIIAQAVTGADGSYRLDGLLPTEYRIRFLLDDNYIAAPYVENNAGCYNHIAAQTPDYGETEPVVPPYAGTLEHIDGAVFRAGVVDGYVLSNANHDGLATNEGGVEGVTATLIDENGLPVSDYSYGISDETGYFVIKGILPGRYAVSYTLPESCAFNAPLTDNTEVRTEYFQMDGGSEQRLQPIGVVYTASIAGKAFRFSNGDPIENVGIKLVSDSFGTVQECATDAEGAYGFDNMRPDTYVLTITLPDGYVFAQSEDSIMPGKISSVISARIALKRGQSIDDANIAADLPASVSGLLYFDRNLNATLDEDDLPVSEREVAFSLNGKTVLTITTDENGSFFSDSMVPAVYQVSVPLKSNELLLENDLEKNDWKLTVSSETYPVILPFVAYGSIGGQVWNLDSSVKNIQDISITLLDENNQPAAAVVTDENGEFAFDKLLPGTYTLNMELPDGYLFARKQDAVGRSSYIQSDVDGNLNFFPIELDVGGQKSGVDVGMGANGIIGDYAWLDANKNGMQDIGESPVPGILIEMYQYGEFVASATTDGIGHYRLENLYPGEYEMRVTMPKELKPTVQQFNYPLVGSILPSSDSEVVSIIMIVPSGGENLHMDLGFVLKTKDVYPDCMKDVSVKNWTPYAER